jgi:hypothetical protein
MPCIRPKQLTTPVRVNAHSARQDFRLFDLPPLPLMRKVNTILRHAARKKNLDDGSVFIRRHGGGRPTVLLEDSWSSRGLLVACFIFDAPLGGKYHFPGQLRCGFSAFTASTNTYSTDLSPKYRLGLRSCLSTHCASAASPAVPAFAASGVGVDHFLPTPFASLRYRYRSKLGPPRRTVGLKRPPSCPGPPRRAAETAQRAGLMRNLAANVSRARHT